VRKFSIIGGVLAGLILVWLIWPNRVDPAYWQEPEAPALTGPLEPRGRLQDAELIGRGLIATSEDIAIDDDGAVYASQHAGSVARLIETEDGWQHDAEFVLTSLPALGLQWSPDGRLIAAASDGLYGLDTSSGEIELLTATDGNGRALGFADDLDIGPDGVIYFTDASWKWANRSDRTTYQLDMAENRPYGVLIAHDPSTGETRNLVEDLYFANGVAMAADGRSVFFLETYRYRLSRYWLEGPAAGQVEIIDDNLPGIPDGVMGDGEGRLYIAMDTQRVPIMRFLHENPFWTAMITKLPEWIWLRAGRPKGFILVMDEDGTYLDSYHDPDGRFGLIANVVPTADGDLWIGSLTEGVVGRYSPQAD
jgi:sugar lactone lactonase YvrE